MSQELIDVVRFGLAERYRVVAPDMRGLGDSSRPPGGYDKKTVAGDIWRLSSEHLGIERFSLVGHDWGGAVAWMVPMLRPEVVHKLIVLNAPHPRAFQREMRTVGQLLKSWYILFFQLPFLPEIALRLGKYRAIERQLTREPKRPRAFSDEDIAAYKEAIAQPGALTAAINYYRATFRRNPAEAPSA